MAWGRSLTRQRTAIQDGAVELLGRRPDYQPVRTIPGIGPIIALTILAVSGDLCRFRRYGQSLKFCVDLATVSFGMFHGRSKLQFPPVPHFEAGRADNGPEKANSVRDKQERYDAQDRHDQDVRREADFAIVASLRARSRPPSRDSGAQFLAGPLIAVVRGRRALVKVLRSAARLA